ncbi:MAG: hypothetical protein KF853_05725 [Rhodocyclaceae bacterium]|nr:hypothetical protein [Rhodocyclaceae bacterium]MBX3676500.1 hypothetical protein [Rhodocyclaceae bacterium]MCP5296167.1 hypothetical protein [Zoogloeaceae bacterium]MCW5595284.1 hypothetical protein [Rhodocyclaceae bacterium]
MTNPLTVARWLLVIPSASVGFVAGYAVVVGLLVIALKSCPPEHMTTALCAAPWYAYVEIGVYCVAAAVWAICTVLLPALVAPGYRANVALTIYIVGLLLILLPYWGRGSVMALPFAIAVVTGGTLVYLIRRRNR